MDRVSQIIWNEKYRPKKLEDIIGQEVAVKTLKAFAEKKNLPNLLLLGPKGSAKTTSALCLVSELYEEDLSINFLEIDSTGRDIFVKIKEFASFKPIGQRLPFKTILVHQLDNMEPKAQHSLRRTMERSASTCRFIYTAQYKDRVIEAIRSRCSMLIFLPYEDRTLISYLARLLEAEGIKYDSLGLKRIVKYSEGDLRMAIDLAQIVATTKGKISAISVYQVLEKLFPQDIKQLFELAYSGDFQRSRLMLRELLTNLGYSGSKIIMELLRGVEKLAIEEREKLLFIKAAAEADMRIALGGEAEIQISSLLARLKNYGKGRRAGLK